MPCYDSRDDYDRRDAEKATRLIKQRLDEMTARACRFARKLEANKLPVPFEDQAWWREHKRFDRREGR